MEISKLAFLETYTLENNEGIMGAILVTDADTKPLEFRVTAPIRPTNFQKTLYGDVLMEHILVELVSVPLLNAVNEQIDLIMVRDPLFLGVNSKQGVRVVKVFDEKDKNFNGRTNGAVKIGGDGSSVFIDTSKKFYDELTDIKDKLKNIAESRNLTEPFERLKIACEQVHLQKTGD